MYLSSAHRVTETVGEVLDEYHAFIVKELASMRILPAQALCLLRAQ